MSNSAQSSAAPTGDVAGIAMFAEFALIQVFMLVITLPSKSLCT